MNKHAQGPWNVDGKLIIDAGDNGIASCYSEANAQLIAAAPELLEALIEIKNTIEVGVLESTLNNKPCRELLIDGLNKLIAKAEGVNI